ncbi:MAG TPA: dihydrolipoyl dehydrogenase [Nitrospiraceae bacterium]|jgi:pyruvate/2-oxoglutarate dehydrogenase complex dihydrolipoamide dehydrogenase (E3) component|nr:dihydrolipoyl dehydrogenase [Nitrospiraceae bacterium]
MESQGHVSTGNTHDVIVIGGGSAGYAAARTARDAGADVAIVDHGPLGGLCILRGCMPSKAILRSAEVAALLRRAKEFGLSPVSTRADLSAIVDRKDRLVREFADYRIQQLLDPSLTLYQSQAVFRSPHEIVVGDTILSSGSFILATGSRPDEVPIPGLAQAGYFTSDTILDLRTLPDSLIVLGGGSVALELGQFFARLGTRVTILQRGRTLLSEMDEAVGRALEAALIDEGIEVVTGVQLLRVTCDERKKTVWAMKDGRERSYDGEDILQALGRRPNIEGLRLDLAEVTVDSGRIVVDGAMRTSQPHIYAVGDVNDVTPIVHLAIQQGEIAAYNVTHPDKPAKELDHRLDAEVVFTDPQVAVVGLNDAACHAGKIPFLTASYPFADHGKALCLGASHGFVKLFCAPTTGELLGAQIVGPEAGELIHELIAVMYYHGTAADLLRMPHYHPTLAEIVTYPAESIVEQLGMR